MQDTVPGYLKYRVIDQNTGAVIIPDLAHLHESQWTVKALQGGIPGSSTIGNFTIYLPAPGTDLWQANQASYRLLAAGQKVEGYLGDAITGSPRFSGVITQMTQPLASPWTITGMDTMWWLQQSQLYNGENLGYASIFPSAVVGSFLGTREQVWGDDFSFWGTSTHPNSSDYTVLSGSWSATTDPVYGLPALSHTGSSTAVISTNTTWAQAAQYNLIPPTANPATSSAKIQGVLVPGTANVGEFSGFEVAMLVSGQQMLLGRIILRQTALAPFYTWAFDAQIYTSDAGGTFTQQAQVQNVLTFNGEGNSTPTIPIEVEMTIDTGERLVRVMVNGHDANCTWGYNTSLLAASGGVGIRASSTATGSPVMYINRLLFESRTSSAIGGWGTNRFATGTFTNSPRAAAPAVWMGSQQTHLDMILMAASFDGYLLRKNPGVGYKADSIDYGPSPGTDLSASVVFEEGVNVSEQGTQVGVVADLYASATRVNAIPGDSTGGQITWVPTVANGSMILTDTVADVGLAQYQLMTSYARLVAQRKANVMQAIQVAVVRTADTADKWRELDFVTVHIPTLGINHQKAQVVGYTFTEGQVIQLVYLNQYPNHALVQQNVDRVTRCLEYVSTVFQQR